MGKIHLLWLIPIFFVVGLIVPLVYQTREPPMTMNYYLGFNLVAALVIVSTNFVGDKIIKYKERKKHGNHN